MKAQPKTIKSINAVNFKAAKSFTTKLDPVTVITGQNFVGKSSRVEAIILALAGYVPGIERKPNAIFDRLSSGKDMTTTLAFDSGEVIVREWSQDKKGSVSAKAAFTGLPDGWTCDPVVVDSATFLGLSETARIKYLFSRTKPEKPVTPDTVIEALNRHVEMNATDAKAILEQIEVFRKSITDRMANSETPQDWLEKLVEETKKWKLSTEQSIKTQTAETTVAGQSTANLVSPDKAAKRLEDARAALSKLDAEHEAIIERRDKLFNILQSIPELEQDIKLAEVLKAEAEALDKKLATQPEVDIQKGKAAAFASEAENKHLAKLKEQAAGLAAKFEAATNAYNEADRAVQEIDKLKCCPTCKAKGKDWKKSILKSLKAVEQEKAEAVIAARDEVKKHWEAVTAQQGIAERALQTLESLREAVRARAATIKAREENRAALAKLEATVALVASKATVEQDNTEAGKRLLEVEAEIVKARAEFEAATEDNRKVGQQRAVEEMLKAAASKGAALEIELAVAKAAVKAVAETLESLVAQSVGKVLDRMNEFCGKLLPAPLAYRSGEIGMDRSVNGDKKFVSFKSFSGTEKALTQCAVSLALAMDGQLRLAIIDEMGRLDEENKSAVVKTAARLIEAGKLDQAIFVDVSAFPYSEMDGVTTITL